MGKLGMAIGKRAACAAALACVLALTAGQAAPSWADEGGDLVAAAPQSVYAEQQPSGRSSVDQQAADSQALVQQSVATEAATWAGGADTSWYSTDKTSFTLSAPEQVAGLAKIVNGTASGIARDTFTGKTVTLAADLKLNEAGGKQVWTAIGDINLGVDHTSSTTIYFDGTFDGAGHKVEGLYMPNSSENYGGYHAFFGSLGPHAQVLKLGIESGSVSGRVAAGIAAVSHTDDAENIPMIVGCYNKATITGYGATSRGTGGIFAGENQKGHEGAGEGYRAAAYIADCYNLGEVSSQGPCGGIAGTGSVKMYSCYNAGTVSSSVGGTMHGALMSNLFAPGSVTAASFSGQGEICDCYAFVGTDSQLYRVLDADHTLDNPLYPDEEWLESAAFLDAQQFDEGSYWLGTAYVDDDPQAPANDHLPLLWWQKGLPSIDMATASVEEIPDQLYSGSAITPKFGVYIDDPNGGYDAIKLNRGGDYRVVFKDNTSIGTAKATVYGVGRYAGSAGTTTFDIVQINLTQCTIDEIAPQWFYGGEAKPKVTVRAPGNTELTAGKDYTVVYAGNTSSGQATVTVNSNGVSTTGQLVAHFYIVMASDHLEGKGTESEPFLLSSKADLQFLSHVVNTDADSKYVDAYYKVACDIDAGPANDNDLGIDPIGINRSPFAGEFDGDGHTITLNMDASKLSSELKFSPYIYDYLGLFSCTGSAGTTTIKNLTVAGSVESDGTAAGFIGSAVDSELVIENCVNKANVRAKSSVDGGAAGFIGVADSTRLTMENCENQGIIRGSSNSSGIVVYLAGGSGAHTFTHCGNVGQVASAESAAGVIQHYAPSKRSSFVCENCYNTGTVTSTRADGGAAGGILGMDQSGSQNAGIDRKCAFISCYNTGTVVGGRHAGGIAGQIYTTPMDFKGCYNTGSVTDNSGVFGAGGICGAVAYRSAGWTFSSCYGAGSVASRGAASKSGAILGWAFAGSQAKLENCYMLDTLDSGCDVAGVGAYNVAQGAQTPVSIQGAATALSAAQMRETGSGGFAARLGSIFSDDLATPLNDGMPVCYWQANNVKTDLSEVTIAPISDLPYIGAPVKVALDISYTPADADPTDPDAAIALIEDVDYQAEYSNNEVPGVATVALTGIGRYRGTAEVTFTIVKGNLAQCEIAPIPDQWSTESGAEPMLTVTNYAGNVLVAGTDYEASYEANVATGEATVTVSGKGYYMGQKTATFNVVRAAGSLSGAGTVDDPYLIGTVEDFAYFMAKVNAGEKDYAFACYQLTGDLDLQPDAGKPTIDPVGTAKKRFRGQFDGAGHTVTLHIDAQGRYKGLFGVVDGVVIKNLTTDGSVVQTVADVAYGEDKIGCVGAIVGYSYDALRMENCTNKASVTSNGAAVAGLVGIADAQGFAVEFVSCRNEGALTSEDELAAGLVTDVRATKLIVRDCSNTGKVEAQAMAAGLIGRPMGSVSETTKVTVSGSFNTGAIKGNYRSGGLVGPVYSYADVTIRNSFNAGAIVSLLANQSASYASGGIAANGGLVGGVGAYSSLVVDRSYNAGLLSSTDITMKLGGLVGYINAGARSAKFTNAFYAGAMTSVGNQLLADAALVLDSSSAVTDTMLKSSTMPEKLGAEFGFDSFGVNGGYPVLGSQRVNLDGCRVSPVASQTYTGLRIVPTLVVYDPTHDRSLAEGSDYELVCENNVNATTGGERAVAHVVGIGAYIGERDVNFDIEPANLGDCTMADIPEQIWTGHDVEPELSIVNEAGIQLKLGTDYTVGYSSNVNVGKASVIARGKGNYKGVLRASFDIVEKTDITGRAVISPIADVTYTGQALQPKVEVTLDGVPMLLDAEYTVAYFDNVNVGTARVVVTGAGAFIGSVEASFKIVSAASDAGGSGGSGSGSGNSGGSGSGGSGSNGSGGSGSGSNGSATTPVAVPIDLSAAEVASIGACYYTGSAICPTPAVNLGGKTLTKEVDYTLSYRNNVNVGLATVVVTGKGAYTGSTQRSFAIKAMPIGNVVFVTTSTASKTKKVANPMKVTVATRSVEASKLKVKKRTVKAITVKKAQGTVTYARVKKGSSAKLSVNKKTGKITVKKGTKKGTYKIKVKVTAKGNARYKAASKTVTAKVKVK